MIVRVPWRGVDRRGERLELRYAERRDAARYLEHMARIVRETPWMLQGPEDSVPDVAEEQDVLEELARRDNCVCVVAARPGPPPGRQPILGSVTLLGGRGRRTRHAAELAMGVQQDAWGAGIGSLLMEAALTWARESPILSRVSLQVFSDNVVAYNLYRSRGFVDEGVMERHAKWDGRYGDLIGMGLEVGP
ncbi:MAG: GNAT family N-acetyltransferase [Myxococcales bacterium]|nr:GNAT family N-acetyltransferase [Myxococcales bacterium]MCB9733011.1 GNAT family N-acetyltransferase [Deltaproteobacteria bacterium]